MTIAVQLHCHLPMNGTDDDEPIASGARDIGHPAFWRGQAQGQRKQHQPRSNVPETPAMC
jgi:hypothetical protein